MIAKYTVIRASEIKIPTQVTLASGTKVMADVPAIEIELVPDDANQGTLVLRMTGHEIHEAQALFQVDTKIDATFKSSES